MKRILLILLIISNVCVTFAQGVEFKASAPAQVIMALLFGESAGQGFACARVCGL